MSPLIVVAYLLALGGGSGGSRGGGGGTPASSSPGRSSNSGGRGSGKTSGRGRGRKKGRNDSSVSGKRGRGDKGRNRYTRDGIKKRTSSADDDSSSRQEELWPLPPLTIPNGQRPSYYTCRHTYENTLMDEIQRFHANAAKQKDSSDDTKKGDAIIVTSTPYPGLVRVEDDHSILPQFYDPVYALQCMPECVVVSAESIKGIARKVLKALLGDHETTMQEEDNTPTTTNMIDTTSEIQRQKLYKAPRGSLSIHPLVPGMCKGQINPVMQHRCTKIGEEISKMLKKIYPAARKAAGSGVDENHDNNEDRKNNPIHEHPEEQWVLQLLLQSPNIAVASITQCQHVGPGRNAHWPNILHPLGMAKVDIKERMPSSAYRKLMEGIECMGVRPAEVLGTPSLSVTATASTTVVDLGACPGGWTSVIRRYFDYCRVIAVDRSELDSTLMKDAMVDFVQGDAFTFQPPIETFSSCCCWMISDVIAYPERITELLSQWCANQWASVMIVTMKFQGNEPDLDELERARQIVKGHGYGCRVKHFFNNKNEVTFMLWSVEKMEGMLDLEFGVVGSPMFGSL